MVDRYDPKYKSELGYEVNAWMDKDADGDWVKYENYEALEAKLAALVTASEEVVRISDRKHDAWDRLKSAIAAAKGTP